MKIGFVGALTIVLVILKALEIINWSWVLVFAPIWISFILSVIFFLVLAIIAFITGLLS